MKEQVFISDNLEGIVKECTLMLKTLDNKHNKSTSATINALMDLGICTNAIDSYEDSVSRLNYGIDLLKEELKAYKGAMEDADMTGKRRISDISLSIAQQDPGFAVGTLSADTLVGTSVQVADLNDHLDSILPSSIQPLHVSEADIQVAQTTIAALKPPSTFDTTEVEVKVDKQDLNKPKPDGQPGFKTSDVAVDVDKKDLNNILKEQQAFTVSEATLDGEKKRLENILKDKGGALDVSDVNVNALDDQSAYDAAARLSGGRVSALKDATRLGDKNSSFGDVVGKTKEDFRGPSVNDYASGLSKGIDGYLAQPGKEGM